ncbi:S-layer homology domain-containing protein [Paenibacillus senegalimassiliensis]|uniref:S-layer homology domain-containing protein n=1 Tax=Paenibacillus senegalimassiliensis TaxID=1737426 RepID=UPI00073EB075|nr:S-layer homology domain-containing protein [Paenibacillus senegalimassiliensis]
MSNTSYSFKENSHLLVNQGGEKKVMKKILSVALSTAMAFSMFASVAFGAEANLSPEQQFNALKEAGIVTGYPDGLSHLERTLTRAELAKIVVNAIALEPVTGVATYKDQNYSASHWAAPYIEAATAAGILQGKDTVKGLFDPSGNVTVQELAKVLVTALELEVPADAENTASPWAKGYVAAAVEAGFIAEGINYQAAATRSQAVVAAYAIYENAQVPSVASYTVSEGGKVVEFKLSNDEVVKVELETALVPNKETEVKFTHNGTEYTAKVTYVTTAAQKVSTVAAGSLKEVVVTFDGTVDAVTAENEDNYSIDDVTIDSATLSEDGTQVTLLLTEDSDALENKEEYTLSVKDVQNSDATVTFDSEVKFTPVDVTAPTVSEVVSLGTSAFKIKFSEPINPDDAQDPSNYSIDGGTIAGSIEYSYPNTVIVNANLSVGEHTIAVSKVKDFSGLVIAPVEQSFDVVEDTAAPEVESIKSNDLKELVITFDETIKNIDEVYANVTSNDAASIKINDNVVTVKLDSAMSYTANTIYIKGVTDYSGNSADRTATVTPTIDVVRPVIVNSDVEKDGDDYIVWLKFNKTIDQTDAVDASNYVLKDADGDVADTAYTDADGNPQLAIEFDLDSEKEVKVNLGSDLDAAKYTLTVSGIVDTAVISNTMLPQTISFDLSTLADNSLDKAWVTGDYLYLNFSSSVATSGNGTALDKAKYYIDGGNYYDGTVRLYNSDTVRLALKDFKTPVSSVATVYASYIKNADGEYFTKGSSYLLDVAVTNVAADIKDSSVVSTTKVTVEFDSKLASVNKNDFTVNGVQPSNASLSSDKKTVTLTFSGNNVLSKADSVFALDIAADSKTRDVYGNSILPQTGYSLNDDIAPEVTSTNFATPVANVTNATYEFKYTVSENIEDKSQTGTKYTQLYVKDLFDISLDGADDLEAANYTISVEADANGNDRVLVIAIDQAELSGVKTVSISFAGGKGAITDDAGNDLKSFSTVKRYTVSPF